MKIEHHVIGPGSEGYEKRIYQLICTVDRVRACYQDTWCSLFKSKGFKKSEYIFQHGCKRVGQLVRKQYGNDVCRWDIELIGSKNLSDVRRCRRQRFLLTIKKGD